MLAFDGFHCVVYIEETRCAAEATPLDDGKGDVCGLLECSRPITAGAKFTVSWKQNRDSKDSPPRRTFAELHKAEVEGTTFVGSRSFDPVKDALHPTITGYCGPRSQRINRVDLELRIYSDHSDSKMREQLVLFGISIQGPSTMSEAFKSLLQTDSELLPSTVSRQRRRGQDHDVEPIPVVPGGEASSNVAGEHFGLTERLKTAQQYHRILSQKAEDEFHRAQYYEMAADKLYRHLPPVTAISYCTERLHKEELSPTMRISGPFSSPLSNSFANDTMKKPKVMQAKRTHLNELERLSNIALNFEVDHILSGLANPVGPGFKRTFAPAGA